MQEENTGFIAGMLDLSAGSIVAGLIAAAVCYKLMFRNFEEFSECIKYWAEARMRHSDQGMFSDEWWSASKVLMWLGVSLAIAYGVNAL